MTTHKTSATTPETAESKRTSRLVLIAAAVTVVLWASAFVVIRDASEHFGPGPLALLRMIVGTLALGGIALVKRAPLPKWRDMPLIAVWGIAWFALYNLALNAAEMDIDAGTTSMLVSLAPLLVILFGGLFMKEGFPKPLILGAPLAFFGVILIASASWGSDFATMGVILALAAALLYAGSTLLQKRLLQNTNATSLTFVGAAAGTLALAPWTGELVTDITHAPLSASAGIVYLGVFPTAIGFTTWAYVLSRTTAGKTAATTYIVPVIVLFMSWLMLGEVPTPVMLVGGVLCLAGVFITRLPAGLWAKLTKREHTR